MNHLKTWRHMFVLWLNGRQRWNVRRRHLQVELSRRALPHTSDGAVFL